MRVGYILGVRVREQVQGECMIAGRVNVNFV